jgi:predicted nucleic acid-binding protein
LEDLIGIDTNILVYALDLKCPEHTEAKKTFLSSESWAVDSTVVHECTLVFKRKMLPLDSKLKIIELLRDPRTTFLNLTKSVSLFALDLATRMSLGGRDSLIGSYLHNRIPEIHSRDDELTKLGKVSFKGRHIRIMDPLRANTVSP